jgi:hypothetical protein
MSMIIFLNYKKFIKLKKVLSNNLESIILIDNDNQLQLVLRSGRR